ncbi:hypothetical protein DIT68_03680 [Brumimicrobium oceani]|uniref:DUF479 domain-containing protein n=2 Tax=Brumimicrobium oceani TaxID=2100725 RepID=A0A2U2XF67_9FLAO|nr:hypothetical protein DIT68_03680 [Brumimicrobium oceani]
MVANLFGDFVKGKDYTYLPKIVQEGVLLHRQIDDFVDHHPVVTELRLHLYNSLPKIAGIAIDLYFDHLLAKNWKKYHPTSLDLFVSGFLDYTSISSNLLDPKSNFNYPSNFVDLLQAIKKHDLLRRYANIEGLQLASEGLSRRISFPNNLDKAVAVFNANEQLIEKVFQIYMKDAIRRFNKK